MDKFERAIANMHNPASKAGLTSVVFVFGASGSGKTRIGWHVHESLRASTTTPMLVGYTAVEDWKRNTQAWMKVPDDAAEEERRKNHDITAAARRLVTIIVKKNQTSSDYKKQGLPGHRVDGEHGPLEIAVLELAAVLRDWAGGITLQAGERGKGLPVCLLIHLDEFQVMPWAAACMVRAIRDANSKLKFSNIRVIPLLTGLETAQITIYLARKHGLATGTEPYPIHLQYFDPRSDDAKRVLISGFKAVAGDLTPPPTIADIGGIQLLRLLFEDAAGWTLGLVRLGAATANRAVLEGGIHKVNWSIVEEDTCNAILRAYEASKSRLGEGLGFSASGWPKLLLLVMAPFEVRGAVPSFCAALFCFCVSRRIVLRCRHLCASSSQNLACHVASSPHLIVVRLPLSLAVAGAQG